VTAIDTLRQLIQTHSSIVYFGGAGTSTESGIPDFRSKDGLYNQPTPYSGYSPEYLLSDSCLEDHPDIFFAFLRGKMDTRSYLPNKAHFALAELERRGKLSAVVTQNIDGLHQKAGSKTVIELHGNIRDCHCESCGKQYPDYYPFLSQDNIPICEDCRRKNRPHPVVRPDVTLYGESLPEKAWRDAIRYIRAADLLIIGGTSGTVYPAAGLVEEYCGTDLVIINRDQTTFENSHLQKSHRMLIIRESIGETLSNAI